MSVAYGDGESVGSIVELRHPVQLQYGLDHHLHLLFLRIAVAYYGLLDLRWRIFVYPDSFFSCRKKNNASCLGNRNTRRDIVGEEKLLNGKLCGTVFVYQRTHSVVNQRQPVLDRRMCGSGYSSVSYGGEFWGSVINNSVTDYRKSRIDLYTNLDVNEQGHLTFGGLDTVELAKQYGTPLYVMDKTRVRENCRAYLTAMRKYFGDDCLPFYASKALCFADMCRLAAEEGMGLDVVSAGELYTAHRAGFPMERVGFHGNNKTDEDIAMGISLRVGHFVADAEEEIEVIEREAAKAGIVQKVLLRVTPGIDPHTHAKIATGMVDSKFGAAIETGAALALTKKILACPHIAFEGFHCHVGSQIFEASPFLSAVDIMTDFISLVMAETGYIAKVLNLGGGFGVRYTEDDPKMNLEKFIHMVADHLDAKRREYGLPRLTVFMEPGRSIVADAGITLYTVGTVKKIPGYKNYVSVDGGMADNPRFTLYEAKYTVLNAEHADRAPDLVCTVAGRCCESGDLIGEGMAIAEPRRGEILAVLTTGAYNFSMASGYNRLGRPALVWVENGESRVAVRRESLADLLEKDL